MPDINGLHGPVQNFGKHLVCGSPAALNCLGGVHQHLHAVFAVPPCVLHTHTGALPLQLETAALDACLLFCMLYLLICYVGLPTNTDFHCNGTQGVDARTLLLHAVLLCSLQKEMQFRCDGTQQSLQGLVFCRAARMQGADLLMCQLSITKKSRLRCFVKDSKLHAC